MALEQLGPYRIARLLGRGGMGAVYEGVHVETGQRTAVKILSIAFADDPAFRARFASEIETLKKLRHPNIVQLIGYGEQDGVLFYSMELVEGKNLHEELQSGQRYDWRDVSDIAIQVCRALKHAHDHGVIHRDLKPANLLRTENGIIKLTDFGIAKLFGNSQLTSVGGVIGTADYMSPEQAEGSAVTPRSDLYNLGGVMYALLTGNPPYLGKSVTDVLTKMKTFDPPPLRAIESSIPQELEDIILQLLHKDPQQRIATPVVLAKRLRAMLHGLATGTQPIELDTDVDEPSPEAPIGVTADVSYSRWNEASWNEETVITEPQQPAPNANPAPITEAGNARQTIATMRYTTVADVDSGAEPGNHAAAVSPFGWWPCLSTFAIISALVGIAALIWYLSRPPAADVLYQRIQAHVASTKRGDLMKVRNDIDDFLKYHAADPRAAEVQALQTDHNIFRLWMKLEREARHAGGIEYMPQVEREFVEAMREEAISLSSAIAKHQRLLDKYASTRLTGAAKECVAASRHVIQRLAALNERHTGAYSVGRDLPSYAACILCFSCSAV